MPITTNSHLGLASIFLATIFTSACNNSSPCLESYEEVQPNTAPIELGFSMRDVTREIGLETSPTVTWQDVSTPRLTFSPLVVQDTLEISISEPKASSFFYNASANSNYRGDGDTDQCTPVLRFAVTVDIRSEDGSFHESQVHATLAASEPDNARLYIQWPAEHQFNGTFSYDSMELANSSTILGLELFVSLANGQSSGSFELVTAEASYITRTEIGVWGSRLVRETERTREIEIK